MVAAYYFSSFRERHSVANVAFGFDFMRTPRTANGLLTPQQQIDWHRARGFSRLAFTTPTHHVALESTAAAIAQLADRFCSTEWIISATFTFCSWACNA
jgi:hypothetical protein